MPVDIWESKHVNSGHSGLIADADPDSDPEISFIASFILPAPKRVICASACTLLATGSPDSFETLRPARHSSCQT